MGIDLSEEGSTSKEEELLLETLQLHVDSLGPFLQTVKGKVLRGSIIDGHQDAEAVTRKIIQRISDCILRIKNFPRLHTVLTNGVITFLCQHFPCT